MTRAWWALITLGLFVGLAGFGLSADDKDKTKDKDKKTEGKVVELDGLKAAVPGEWKEETPGPLRHKQFNLPKAKDDPFDGEVVIFKGLGGKVQDTVDRWTKNYFKPPKGKKTDDVAKVTEITVGGNKATLVEMEGIYLYRKRPGDPNEKPTEREDHRLVGVIFDVGNTPYQIRLIGPAKTVEQYKKGFEEWVKALK